MACTLCIGLKKNQTQLNLNSNSNETETAKVHFLTPIHCWIPDETECNDEKCNVAQKDFCESPNQTSAFITFLEHLTILAWKGVFSQSETVSASLPTAGGGR